MKRRVALITVISAAMFLWLGSTAFAAFPHADFTTNPDACAACHRMHTATAKNLLKDSKGTCVSCHKDALGADCDVMNGVYTDPSGEDTNNGHTWGVNGDTLLGGGFDAVNGAATTSIHKIDTTSYAPGKNVGADPVELTCVSCHTAHPDKLAPDQYRLLRTEIGNVSGLNVLWNGPWSTLAQTAHQDNGIRAYTDTDFTATDGVYEFTRNYKSGIAAWCTACHTHYLATDATPGYKQNDSYNAGDSYGPVNRYRHTVEVVITGRVDPYNDGHHYDLTTDQPLQDLGTLGRTADDTLTCLSCHRAHGSAATMTGLSVIEARGTVLPSGTDSMLLKTTTGRKLCADCHFGI